MTQAQHYKPGTCAGCSCIRPSHAGSATAGPHTPHSPTTSCHMSRLSTATRCAGLRQDGSGYSTKNAEKIWISAHFLLIRASFYAH